MGSFSGVGPQGSRGERDRGRRERRRGGSWANPLSSWLRCSLRRSPCEVAMPLPTATREGRVAVTSGLRVQVGGRGGRRPGRFCGQKVVRQPGEAAEVDAAGTTGRAPSHAASLLPRILPTGRVTGHGAHRRLHAARDLEPQLELGSQPHFPRGPAPRLWGCESPLTLSPSHRAPPPAPRPAPWAEFPPLLPAPYEAPRFSFFRRL